MDTGVARGIPPIFRTYSHFVLWEAVSQNNVTRLKSNILAPSKFLGWLRYCSHIQVYNPCFRTIIIFSDDVHSTFKVAVLSLNHSVMFCSDRQVFCREEWFQTEMTPDGAAQNKSTRCSKISRKTIFIHLARVELNSLLFNTAQHFPRLIKSLLSQAFWLSLWRCKTLLYNLFYGCLSNRAYCERPAFSDK